MSEESHLLVDQDDGILTLTMNRPAARNALSPQMLVKLANAWYEFRDSESLRVAILTGAGTIGIISCSKAGPCSRTRFCEGSSATSQSSLRSTAMRSAGGRR